MPSTVAGLQGGTAPARAFHDFMTVAVANRPVEAVRDAGADARLAADARKRKCTATARSTRTAWRRWSTRTACRSAPPPPEPRLPAAQQPMVRPDGTGEPSQQELDQAFPPQQQQPAATNIRSAAAAAQPPRPPRQPRSASPRPIRRSRGPTRRSAAFASASPGPNSRASSALNSRPVVEVDEVRDLVRDDVAAHVGRREDQPPAQAGSGLATSSCPSACAASPTLTARGATPAALGELGDLAATWCRSARRLRNASMRRAQPARRAAAAQLAVRQPRRARRGFATRRSAISRPSIGIDRAGRERLAPARRARAARRSSRAGRAPRPAPRGGWCATGRSA